MNEKYHKQRTIKVLCIAIVFWISLFLSIHLSFVVCTVILIQPTVLAVWFGLPNDRLEGILEDSCFRQGQNCQAAQNFTSSTKGKGSLAFSHSLFQCLVTCTVEILSLYPGGISFHLICACFLSPMPHCVGSGFIILMPVGTGSRWSVLSLLQAGSPSSLSFSSRPRALAPAIKVALCCTCFSLLASLLLWGTKIECKNPYKV